MENTPENQANNARKSRKNPGALPAEWAAVRSCPLGRWAVPIVCNPALPTYKGRRMAVGKVPSLKTAGGEIVGIPDWSNRAPAAPADLEKWAADGDMGFGIRLGHDGLIALDCDCDTPETSRAILELFLATAANAGAGAVPIRRRGTERWAALVRLQAGDVMTKRIYHLGPAGTEGALEILGAGQQLACAGTHPTGVRYEWKHAPISETPAIPLESMEALFACIRDKYGSGEVEASAGVRIKGQTYQAPDRLADWLRASGAVLDEGSAGELHIRCPWEAEHSPGAAAVTATTYFPAGVYGYPEGGFKCLHSHCQGRTVQDLEAWARGRGYSEIRPEDWPVETSPAAGTSADSQAAPAQDVPIPPECQPSPGSRLMRFRNEKTGLLDPTGEALEIAIDAPEIMGAAYALDTFAGGSGLRVRETGGEWRDFEDEDLFSARLALEGFRFDAHKISRQLLRDAIGHAGRKHRIDSMREFLSETIPAWDGIPRIDAFFEKYCGAEGTPWAAAVGRYMWTAMWGRATCTNPKGIKADITPVLVGPQGSHKTSVLRALAIRDEWCGEIDFEKSDDDNARMISEKLIAEIPELGGMSKRENNSIKAFLTRSVDEWVPKYRETRRTRPRRCIFIMTTNDKEFLTDPTGERRWAPVSTGVIDTDAVRADILQLWAEAREAYQAEGIAYKAVEALQADETEDYRLSTPLEDATAAWLRQQSDSSPAITTERISSEVLGEKYATLRRGEKAQICAIMRRLGYEQRRRRDTSGARVYAWIRPGTEQPSLPSPEFYDEHPEQIPF